MRTACLGVAAILSLLAPAGSLAQERTASAPGLYASQPLGSLTVVSEPSGVVVTLKSEQITVAGRTPWTVARGLEGVFEVTVETKGYERWRREVYLHPTIRDSLEIRLVAKNRLWAGLRSLIIPGWGQKYSGRSGVGALFLIAEIGGGVGVYLTDERYWDRQDELQAAWQAYARSTVQSEREELWQVVEERREDAEDADNDRDMVVALLAAVHLVNVFDSVLFFPSASPGRLAGASRGLYAQPGVGRVDIGFRMQY